MIPFQICYLAAILAFTQNCWCKIEERNENSEKSSSVKIDTNLKKALLDALLDLENDEKLKAHEESESLNRIQSLETATTNADLQKAPASSFSIITHTENLDKLITTEKTSTTQSFSEKPSVIIQRSNGIQEKPKVTYITAAPRHRVNKEQEQFVASASSSFADSSSKVKNILASKSTNDRISNNLLGFSDKSRLAETATIQPIITSSTEESEAKVEDLQFFAAPLVAAFTVHHDALGIPKSVEPIYKGLGQNGATTKQIEEQRTKLLQDLQLKQQDKRYREEQITLQQYLRQQEQLRLQLDLQEKQRILDQQIRTLQQQQQQRDYLLQQQQIFQEQQRQKLLEEQKKLLPTTKQNTLAVNNNFNQNQFTNKGVTSTVSFQPSLTFQAPPLLDNSLLPPRVQAQNFLQQSAPLKIDTQFQLPIKNAETFRPQQQFFNQFKNFNSLQSLSPPAVDYRPFGFKENLQTRPQGNRVLRQELGTGNFGSNDFNNYNRNNYNNVQGFSGNSFSITPSISQAFHSTRNVRTPNINEQLNNLLYYSGITQGNRQEDLNIVSKVLSLNHVGGDNYFGGSETIEQRLIPPKLNLVPQS